MCLVYLHGDLTCGLLTRERAIYTLLIMSLLGHVSKIVSILLSKLAIVPLLTHCYATVTTHF